ncbi:hypothetical protein FB451DRAFT_1413706 [Mycena latifolia]|nr:hypothetical protein FB451DRAFT_1413706 [Mycena latifolia]
MPKNTKGKSKEVQAVQDDIEDMVHGLSPAVQKRWFRYTPKPTSSRDEENYSPIPSPAKKPQPKRKADEVAVKTETIDPGQEYQSDSSIKVLDTPPPKKKLKSSSRVSNDDDDDDDSVEMAFCLYVETPVPPVLNVRKTNTKPPPPKVATLGPYEFLSSINYNAFLRIIADGCRTSTANLDTGSMQWTFDRPGNSKLKPLTTETGFKVMLKALKDRHKDYNFSITMSPPSPVKKELVWILTHERFARSNEFLAMENDLAAAGPNSALSIRQQIAGIDNASNEPFNALLDKYPVDNSPLFPGKRIYHNETGYFDLTDIRLRVWAVAIAKGSATIDRAPASSHFFKNQTIRPPNTSSTLIPATNHAAPPATDPLLTLLLNHPVMQMMNNPLFQHTPYGFMHPPLPHAPPHFGMPTAPPPAAPQPHPQSADTPPPIILPRDIDLDEYCARYNIKSEDRRIYEELGYVPGDDEINHLTDVAWEATKVLPLAKTRILRQHAKFMKDVSDGLWN